jgi:hypothetical protein
MICNPSAFGVVTNQMICLSRLETEKYVSKSENNIMEQNK